jgi:hypothetical protein
MSDDRTQPTTRAGGLFIIRGSRLAVPRFSLRLGDDGSLSLDAAFHLGLDMCPYWLEIATAHAIEADARHRETLDALRSTDDLRLASALEAEFSSGMQAIVAAPIAVDALYATVLEHIQIPPEMLNAWATNRTKRYKRIAEVFRRSFRIGPRSSATVRQMLKELFDFRDRAVHPRAEAAAPVAHPDFPELGVEWRFVAFRSENAKAATANALRLIAQLTRLPRAIAGLEHYCTGAQTRVVAVVERWEAHFGELLPRNS